MNLAKGSGKLEPMLSSQANPLPTISRSRVETLFDGIFAIAMTLLVLELRVPDLKDPHSASQMVHQLAKYGYVFTSYALSFVILGGLWFRHNYHCRHFRIITRWMLLFHMVQMAMAAVFPYCAELVGRYPHNNISIIFYAGSIVIYQWAAWANWVVAQWSGALTPETTPEESKRISSRHFLICLVISAVLAMVVLTTAF